MYFNNLLENKKFLLLDEYKNLRNEYISYAKLAEENRIRFSAGHAIRNKKDNKLFLIDNSFKSYLKSYFNTLIQRLIYNKQIAKEQNLIPFFVTFTLPSEYHPFKTYKKKNPENWELNENFNFNSIQKATQEGYLQLNLIFRFFYKTLKTGKREVRKYGKNIRYNGFFEYHKSFIPHFHLLVYIPYELKEWIYKVYNNTLEKFGMNSESNKIIEIQAVNELEGVENKNNNIDKLDGAVLYISKYISKNLKEIMDIPDNLEDLEGILDSESFNNFKLKEKELYIYLGWKLINNIRIFRGNNTKIGVKNYKKIYYNLTEQEKEQLLNKAKQEKTCLLYEIEKLATRYTKILSNNDIKKKIIKNNFTYKVIEVKEKIKKVKYTSIFKLFSVVKIYEKLQNIDNFFFDYNFITAKNKLEQGILFNTFIKDFKRFINNFNFVIKYHFRKRLDVDFDKNFINTELNKNKIKILENIVNKFEGKEQIFKSFVKQLIKQFNFFKKNKNNMCYKDFLTEIETELNIYYQNFKKWIESDLSFAELFFRTDYKLIKYKIYKNNINIYDKNDYILQLINPN